MLFLIDGKDEHHYSELIERVNGSSSYIPYMRSENVFDYFVNLLVALCANKNLTLLDADISEEEMDCLRIEATNAPKQIEKTCVASVDELIEKVFNSTSEINLFTSGTTGQPKKVTHSIQTLTRTVRRGAKYRNNIWAYAYNPTHMAGLQVFFQALANMNTLVNVFNGSRNYVYEAIDKWMITHISGTPTFYRLLLPFERPFGTVERITFGGEKSDGHLYNAIQQLFPNAKVTNVYASTEAGSLFAASGDAFRMKDEVRAKVKIVDGELLIHKSLLGTSENFEFDNGYYHSGDLIEWVDESKGLFVFKSRKNELINVGGYKVNPSEIENAVLGLEGVKQVAVYGKPNSVLGNVLCADVVLFDDSPLTPIDIRRQLGESLQDFKIPRRVKIVPYIELTRTGKQKRS